ncbi:uncharacterized protein EV420DRAFT_1597643 [Desarmillaria tabescens]|uniref:RING-type domain-containing protein n=1 Tax=Armillaria tabescens TaxID=1929756 RepID=A0AA39J2T9_ARMTA|nr:uncharacterized protein EV420DRAFT_1597643 [Desarmillaria tabescens]KAK0434261.1 hypothetical protein EV420DRAFT_1597643 [Desarmillaria tabescens]
MIEDIDEATSALIAQLTLQDITEISGARKGKGRSDVAKSDEEYALDLQADYWRMELDLQLAQSLSRALETDANWLAVEQAAEDDHRYALALSNGAELPAQSANQSLLENPAFVRTLFTHHPPTWQPMLIVASVLRVKISTAMAASEISSRLVSTTNHCTLSDAAADLLSREISYHSFPFPLRTRFQIKSRELGTPAMSRVYCQNPICSAFLGSSEGRRRGHAVCPLCKQNAHRGENYLSQDCHSIIELNHGCYHMTCRCLTQFCYVCAVPWKNCHCPQWDEDRLYITAQRRVEEEMGPRATAAAPDIFQREVAARAEQLRSNHDLPRCEECSWYLREYLLVCTHCGLAACVRCCRNRLL